MKYEELKQRIETLEYVSKNTSDVNRAYDLSYEIVRLKNLEIEENSTQ